MKKNQLSLLLKASMFMLALMFVFSACKKDDDDDNDNPVLIEDGIYLTGDATPYTALNTNSMMEGGINEVGQAARAGMYEKYTSLKAGSTFTVTEVKGTAKTTWGPATSDTVHLNGERDQIRAIITKGTLGNSGTFEVEEDGMYHVIIDKNTNTFIVAPITHWAILGGATEAGWSDTPMELDGGFNAQTMTWKAEGLTLREGNFKFRYSGGWKIEIASDSVRVNTNFGGAVEGEVPNLTTTLVPGGSDYLLTGEQEGIYDVTLTWTAEDGYTSSLERTGTVEPLDYPEQLFMVGASVNGWDWTKAVELIPVHSKPHLFWKIVWLEADSNGFKFNDTLHWSGGEFGKTGEYVDGIIGIGTEDVQVPGETGYYMVTVNLETNEIAVTEPMVYIIGLTLGATGFDVPLTEANLFTVDNANQVITITKDLAAENLRMFAWMDKGWFTDWWQAEFNIFDGVIEYRGIGGDQTAVPVGAGNTTISLNFKEDTGTITPNVK